jgi:FkbM family methyltransferase
MSVEASGQAIRYASQFRQDEFLDRFVFRGVRGGFFVDVGAHDGEQFSNTVAFERYRGWRGICIEPNPTVFEKLRRARKAECLQCCIASHDGTVSFLQIEGASEMLSGIVDAYAPEHLDRIAAETSKDQSRKTTIEVPAARLRSIFAQRGITDVHFLSVDTEGSEKETLRSIDFDRTTVHVIAVENNYRDRSVDTMLRAEGFVPLIRLAVDTIYINAASRFFSRALVLRALLLRAAARIERKLRRLHLLRPGEPMFPYKKPA